MRLRNAWLGLALVALLSACASAGQRESRAEQEPTSLQVDNRSTLDMTIYVIARGGARQRLGTATALTVSTFRIPARLIFGISSMSFQADPIGGRAAPVTQEINVSPGDVIVMQIPPM